MGDDHLVLGFFWVSLVTGVRNLQVALQLITHIASDVILGNSRVQRSDERSLWQENPQRAGPLIPLGLAFRNKSRMRAEQLLTPNPALRAVGTLLKVSKAALS